MPDKPPPTDDDLKRLIARIYDVITPEPGGPVPQSLRPPEREREVIRRQIAACVNDLPIRERRVLLRRFGLASAYLHGDTLAAIADDLGLPVAEVRRLEENGLRRIRAANRAGR